MYENETSLKIIQLLADAYVHLSLYKVKWVFLDEWYSLSIWLLDCLPSFANQVCPDKNEELSNEVLYEVLSQGASELPEIQVKNFKKDLPCRAYVNERHT